MRSIFLITLLLTAFQSSGQQNFQSENGRIFIEEIREIPGRSKEDLFDACKLWFSQNFRNAGEVITAESKDQGYISGEYISPLRVNGIMMDISHKIQVDFKDGRYKIRISNIERADHTYTLEQYWLKNDGSFRSSRAREISQAEADFNTLFDDLSRSLRDPDQDTW